jgi:hypothetical protein
VTLMAMMLYVVCVLLYAAVYGGDVVIALVDRQLVHLTGSNAARAQPDGLLLSIDCSLTVARWVTIAGVAHLCITRLPLSGGTYLALGSLCCLVLRRAIPGAGEVGGLRLPFLSIRATILEIGMFYLIAAGLVR